ncbi:hypothetical protein BKA80DRAFT_66017 [Phyllosticta citrichinensis]
MCSIDVPGCVAKGERDDSPGGSFNPEQIGDPSSTANRFGARESRSRDGRIRPPVGGGSEEGRRIGNSTPALASHASDGLNVDGLESKCVDPRRCSRQRRTAVAPPEMAQTPRKETRSERKKRRKNSSANRRKTLPSLAVRSHCPMHSGTRYFLQLAIHRIP